VRFNDSEEGADSGLQGVFAALSDDLDRCFRRLDNAFKDPETDEDYGYDEADGRSYVRAAFACIEGVCFATRIWATAHLMDEGRVSDEETWAANLMSIEDEVRRSMDDLSLEENASLTFSLLDRVYGVEPQLDTSRQWWSSFNQAIALRDRLYHPRTAPDLDISVGDVMTVVDAEAGFRLQVSTYLEMGQPPGTAAD
jgi:hypothetical protein